MMSLQSKIMVCYHKEDFVPTCDFFYPIHVGSSISKLQLAMQRDDSGINISSKNKSYCELTALYWAWKNLKHVQYIGLAHYRRYFDLTQLSTISNMIYQTSCDNIAVYYKDDYIIQKRLEDKDVILAKPRSLSQSVKQQYKRDHRIEDLDILEEVIKEISPQYIPAFQKVMQSHHFSPYNMFISRWDWFDSYCSWLFTILEIIEQRIKTTDDIYQQRALGFLSERMLNIYCLHHKHRIGFAPILTIGNGIKIKSNIRYQLKRLYYTFLRK